MVFSGVHTSAMGPKIPLNSINPHPMSNSIALNDSKLEKNNNCVAII